MKFNREHYMAPKECPFTYKGQNLAECRRVLLNKIAKSLDIDFEPSDAGNKTLGAIVKRAQALRLNSELSKPNG